MDQDDCLSAISRKWQNSSLCVMKLSGENVFEKVPIAFKGWTEATDQHAPIQ